MQEAIHPAPPTAHRWSPRSLAILVLVWLILQIGGLFSPGLLDDVDSVYIQIAREMLQRHDYVTPYIDGIRFFDKPPLMYWMAAASMRLFGIHDWAARLPLALCVLALLLSTYALGIRLFANISPTHAPDRGGFYAALALATSIGPYLYTRFYIPDILLALWMTLAVHLFLIALDRIHQTHPQPPTLTKQENRAVKSENRLVEQENGAVESETRLVELENRVPHSSQSHRDEWAIAPQRDPLSSTPHNTDPLSPQTHNVVISTEAAHTVSSVVEKPASLPTPLPTPTAATTPKSPLLPCLAFAAVMALNVLTKGLIGLVFPIAFVFLYLAITRQLHLLLKLHLLASTLVFLAIAAPWHILAALRTPAIALPSGLGLPATGGWAWFYLYNEHVARFLSKRIPHDYGLTPVWLFWLYLAIWVMPWTPFLPSAILTHLRSLRRVQLASFSRDPGATEASLTHKRESIVATLRSNREASLALLLWAIIVLGFFSISNRQEYYSLPAIPAFALMAAGLLARADKHRPHEEESRVFDPNSSIPTASSPLEEGHPSDRSSGLTTSTTNQALREEEGRHFDRSSGLPTSTTNQALREEEGRHFDRSSGLPTSTTNQALREEEGRHFDRSSGLIAAQRRNPLLYQNTQPSRAAISALNWHLYLLLPLTTIIAAICAWFALTAPRPAPNTDLSTLLNANPEFYNLSLGHLFDLTGDAMGLFRGPLTAVALSMLAIGLGSYLLRRRGHTYAANLTLAAAMTVTLLAAHEGLARFYPILGSKQLALAINEARQTAPRPNDLILLDGELTSGSTLLFYTGQPVHLLNGRVNGLWYGSFWPDSPSVFETESTLRQLWQGPRRVFFFTYNPAARTQDLTPYAPVHTLASAGGKTILTNH